MYDEWYGVCDCVGLSVVEVWVDYGGVNVFHVCLDFDVVYGVGVWVQNTTQHSTVTTLHTLYDAVAKGFNQMAPTALTITVAPI